MEDPPPIRRKVVMLGPPATGKTALLTRYVAGAAPEAYLSSVGLKVDQVRVPGTVPPLELLLWDLSGGLPLDALPPYYLAGCHGYLYVIDLSRPETFRRLRRQRRCLSRLLPACPGLIVGNKRDLLSPRRLATLQRRLSPRVSHFVSAASGHAVADPFAHLPRLLLPGGSI
mgnify:FL=1